MSTNTMQAAPDLSLLDRVGDAFTSVTEGISQFITRLFGSSNERAIRRLGYVRARDGSYAVTPGSLLARVNALEDETKALSDEALSGLTAKFRARLKQGETLEDLMPEAFAACREAGRRTKNMRHFDVQILGGAVLHEGNIAEMVTGEGKTLVATLPAYLNALSERGVHVVTVNDYLARRDCEWMLPIYRALGMSAGYIQSDMDPVTRRKAYDCDITYGTNSEFGFDYLRDNMKRARWNDPEYHPLEHQCQKALHFAIIDEVDNILIDEARTPLIISGQAHGDLDRFVKADQIARQLSELQKQSPGTYFEVKEKEHTCHLTDEGVRKAEELANVESFYTAGNMEWPHLIDNALKAHHLYHRDKRYVVMPHPETREMSVIIVDEFTGRLMIGRQWSDGLHQAVEAKHLRDGVKIKEETQTLATVTLQNYFKLYKKLAGMTGTAMTEANEFWKIYKLDVIAIPTNKPLSRINHPDVIYRTEKEKWQAVVEEVVQVHNEGRPILIGTTDVDKSEKLSAMLKRRGIKHELLNAKPEYAAREAEIVAQAGRVGAVTISTNMAGRGTDIILGGNPEAMAWAQLQHTYQTRLDIPENVWKQTVDTIEAKEKTKEEGRKVAAMGGLHIVGSERHEARRIDNQLRGRAGRQGDPGSSRFFLSLQDDLMRIFMGEWVTGILERLGMEEGQAIESRMVSRRIEAAQKKVEERNFDIRKNLLEYDEVMDHQRKRVYGYRQEILEGANCKIRLLSMLDDQVDAAVNRFLDDSYGAASFAEFASKRLGVELDASEFVRSDYAEAERSAHEKAARLVPSQIEEALEENLGADVDPKDWNWQALAHLVNTRFGLKYTDRQLRQLGREKLSETLTAQAIESLNNIDLAAGRDFLQPDWGYRSISDWVRLKFQVQILPESLADKNAEAIKAALQDQVRQLYRMREIEFPVTVGMARFMSDRGHVGGGQRYDREGLYQWSKARFPAAKFVEEDFRTQMRSRLREILMEASRSSFPKVGQDALDEKWAESLEGATYSEAADALELAEWAAENLGLELNLDGLTGVTPEQVRQVLWNTFDEKYRPEMHRMERSLVLGQLDTSWKNHLYVMDHLRHAVGLRGYAQEDPKTVYKREGMQEFDTMWESISDKVTETVFRMEDEEGFQDSLWDIGALVKEAAPQPSAYQGENEQAIAGSQQGEKKQEPIRNRGERVGRNDPCPCGSGKKYKNCHMRQQAAK